MATVGKTPKPSTLPRGLSPTSLPLVLTIAAIAVGLAALLPIIQSSGATTTNTRVQRLRQELTDWDARTQALQAKMANLGGLDRIEREAAKRFKMVPPQETIYLQVDAAEPEPHKLPSRFLPPPEPSSEPGGSSLWEKLFGWIPRP
ncbi:MAG: septum formation initiator family protein [Dehalococcoidia bacterium]